MKQKKLIRPRYTGITVAAKDLGVTPQHVRMVLNGDRKSKRLMDRIKRNYPGYLTVEKAS